MPSLLETNPYLKDVVMRHRVIAQTARQSSVFEGAHGLKLRVHLAAPAKRRLIASAKKLVKAT